MTLDRFKWKSIFSACLFLLSAIILPTPIFANQNDGAYQDSRNILIQSVQTGSVESASNEYVLIYNNSDQEIDVTNWCLIYSSASDKTSSTLSCIRSQKPSIRLIMPPKASFLFASNEYAESAQLSWPHLKFKSGLASTSGHVKLLDESSEVIDKVGWGAATSPELQPAPDSSSSEIITRKLVQPGILKDNNNNSEDFYSTNQSDLQPKDDFTELEIELENRIIQITEVLPNAEGADTGKEFVEFFNPNTDAINLKDYYISLGPDYIKNVNLPDLEIQSSQYLILSDIELSLTLPNTSADLKLFSPSGDLVSFVPPYEELEEGQSWIFLDGNWVATFTPTPARTNIFLAEKLCGEGKYRNQETGMCRNIELNGVEKLDCSPGQERNPETNRCRKISTASSAIKQCAPGFVRNSQTNRCRSLLSTTSAKTPCKSGQFRNPETGRCKNAQPASGAVKPCPEGQSRNLKTNRCRKNPASNTEKLLANVKDVASPLLESSPSWFIAGTAATGSLGYAAYEWRRDAINWLRKFKERV